MTVRVSSPGYVEKALFMPEVQIAGVIRNEHVTSPGAPDPPVVYVPLAQVPSPQIKILVRTRNEAPGVMPAIRQAIHEIDPSLPLGDVATMEQVRSRTLSGASRPAWLIGVFAGIAVLLAGIGLYGVISHAVTQRRGRSAYEWLGARSGSVLFHLRNAMVMIRGACSDRWNFRSHRVMKNCCSRPRRSTGRAGGCVFVDDVGWHVAGFLPAARAAQLTLSPRFATKADYPHSIWCLRSYRLILARIAADNSRWPCAARRARDCRSPPHGEPPLSAYARPSSARPGCPSRAGPLRQRHSLRPSRSESLVASNHASMQSLHVVRTRARYATRPAPPALPARPRRSPG